MILEVSTVMCHKSFEAARLKEKEPQPMPLLHHHHHHQTTLQPPLTKQCFMTACTSPSSAPDVPSNEAHIQIAIQMLSDTGQEAE